MATMTYIFLCALCWVCSYTYMCKYRHVWSIYVCLYTPYIYSHAHVHPNFFLQDGNFCMSPCGWVRHIFSTPQSHLLPALPHLFSGTPTSPTLLHTGVTVWSGAVGKAALWDSLEQSRLNVLFPLSIFLLGSVKLPREKEQRSGVYRMSVFKVTLCVSTFFFKHHWLLFLFWWWINNTKRSLVKEGNERAGVCEFPGT